MASFRMQTIWLIEYYTEINHTEINNDNLSDYLTMTIIK